MDMSEEQMELQKKAKEYLKQKVNEGEKGMLFGLGQNNPYIKQDHHHWGIGSLTLS